MKIISLIVACAASLAGLLVIVFAKGIWSAAEMWGLLGVALLITAIFGASALLVARGVGQPPIGYEKRRAEFAQWGRWYNCLYTYPLLLTWVFLMAETRSLDHTRGPRDVVLVIYIFALSVMALAMASQLIAGRRGAPGSPERRHFERLNDELRLAHAGEAYRWGFYALGLGMLAVLGVAIAARFYVLPTGIAAFWVGAVITSVRFGLLQRAAERGGEAE